MKDSYVYPGPSGNPGIELRDFIAALIVSNLHERPNRWEAARIAYAYADAMIEVRNDKDGKND